MSQQIAFGLIGGLGLFFFGMQMMASGMQNAAGDNLRKILDALTSNPYMATVTGIIVTLFLQSSSTTSVMVVGFANAGLMTLSQAVGTILGANIGTTITAQVISFDISLLVLPTLGAGAMLNFYAVKRYNRYIGQSILGFGLLFLGLTTMSQAMHPLREYQPFIEMLATFGRLPVLGALVGALFTAIIQSSSATAGVVIALTLQGLIDTPSSIAIVLGANIGTCITAALASIGTNLTARRAVLAMVIIKTLGVVVVLLFFRPFVSLVGFTGVSVTRQVANAHTIFNVLNVLMILPFLQPFLKFIARLMPGEEERVEAGTKFLEIRMLKTPSVAIGGARQEILRMATLAREILQESVQIFIGNDAKLIKHALQKEDLIDSLEKDITVYLSELSQYPMNIKQSQTVAALMHATSDLERIGDHSENIISLADTKMGEKLQFSVQALEELKDLYTKVDRMLEKSITAFAKEDIELAREVIAEDDIIDDLERTLRKHHIERLNQKKCMPQSGVIYLDIISNLERVADHATNLAQVVTGDF